MEPPTAAVDADRQPPLSLPFAHFVAGAVLLIVGGAIVGLGSLVLPIRASDAGTMHLLLAGWIGLTIMGAMELFVPVWSGTSLYSERLSIASLWLVLIGVGGTVIVFLFSSYRWFLLTATVLLLGFWTFGYVIVRTLPSWRSMDVTEAHFLAAVLSLLVGTVFGWLLAVDVGYGILNGTALTPQSLLPAHLTLTVFGFISLTIVGALYQLGPMFTQSETTSMDAHLQHVEMVAMPGGVLFLATGRLLDHLVIARFGAVAFLLGGLCFAVFLGRRLQTAQVEPGPMLRRYWLVVLSLGGWVVLSVPGWTIDPLSYFLRFGSPRGTHLLFIGVFTLTIVGTMYHVVPFIIWFNEYSDDLGYERVPMIDDLYDSRIARVEFWFLATGLGGLWVGEFLHAPTVVLMIAGNLLGVGVLLFVFNMGRVVARHRPETGREVLSTLRGHAR